MDNTDINILDWDVCTCEYTSPSTINSTKSWVQELKSFKFAKYRYKYKAMSTSTERCTSVYSISTYSSTTSLIFTYLNLYVIQKRHLKCKKSCRTFEKILHKIFELLHPMWHFLAKFGILYHSACSFRLENFLMTKPLLSIWESNLNLLIAKPDSKTSFVLSSIACVTSVPWESHWDLQNAPRQLS